MLQLQRFVVKSGVRKKLNDEVSFPLMLNMNHFLDENLVSSPDKLKSLIAENPLISAKSEIRN